MNRLVLIGNGFDLAHGLNTRYSDFICWYWEQRVNGFIGNLTNISEDPLCSFEIKNQKECWNVFANQLPRVFEKVPGKVIIQTKIMDDQSRYKVKISPFLERIIKGIETKGWVDIENEYYELLKKFALEEPSHDKLNNLNNQLQYVQGLLTKYLNLICQKKPEPIKKLQNVLYSPIQSQDISIERTAEYEKYIENCYNKGELYWKEKLNRYGLSDLHLPDNPYEGNDPDFFSLPDNILLLNFNYTNTADAYLRKDISHQIHIHGQLSKPESIIFGYGDEHDDDYKKLQKLNDNECLCNVKTIKYQESDNYRRVLRFVDSAPFQVCIMGHSCGNSDRTLLNTLFEHRNCISIKPYFHQKEEKDNYFDLIQNISRNFTDMKLMRDRVVNKTYCEPLPQGITR